MLQLCASYGNANCSPRSTHCEKLSCEISCMAGLSSHPVVKSRQWSLGWNNYCIRSSVLVGMRLVFIRIVLSWFFSIHAFYCIMVNAVCNARWLLVASAMIDISCELCITYRWLRYRGMHHVYANGTGQATSFHCAQWSAFEDWYVWLWPVAHRCKCVCSLSLVAFSSWALSN